MKQSNAKLAEMVVEVTILQHAPAPSGDRAERRALRPRRRWPPLSESINQRTQRLNIVVPRRRLRVQECRRTLRLPVWPRQHVNREPIDHGKPERACRLPCIQVAESLAKAGTHVTHHLRRR